MTKWITVQFQFLNFELLHYRFLSLQRQFSFKYKHVQSKRLWVVGQLSYSVGAFYIQVEFVGYQDQEWKCSGLMFKRAGFQKYVANFNMFYEYLHLLLFIPKVSEVSWSATLSFFNVIVGPACLVVQLSGSCKKTLQCLFTNQMSPMISWNKSGSKSMVQILYLAISFNRSQVYQQSTST